MKALDIEDKTLRNCFDADEWELCLESLVDWHDPNIIEELCGSPVSFVDCLTKQDFNTPEERLPCAFVSNLAPVNEIILVESSEIQDAVLVAKCKNGILEVETIGSFRRTLSGVIALSTVGAVLLLLLASFIIYKRRKN